MTRGLERWICVKYGLVGEPLDIRMVEKEPLPLQGEELWCRQEGLVIYAEHEVDEIWVCRKMEFRPKGHALKIMLSWQRGRMTRKEKKRRVR